ncbi:MAG: NAD-dependent epimerase/dehydratase family protein [Gammaproteobacteria bacterium]|nr:NAD-dependent epimerase/dehydratase family protein [Gammaproteobacteria bacterium]
MYALERASRIYVAGHTGLVGSAMLRKLSQAGFSRTLTAARSELDLTDRNSVKAWFAAHRPHVVVLCAARVGGILANASAPVEFLLDNLHIQNNVIHTAHETGVEQLVFLGSSCIYPREANQPIGEDSLLTAPLEPTNRPYAIAKIAGIELCWALNRQHQRRYFALMPTNLYGPEDNFDLFSSHVLPALIRKMHEARERADASVTLWGTGEPKREFLYSDDLADAALYLLERPAARLAHLFCEAHPPLLNVGTGQDIRIRELADKVARTVGFEGALQWDTGKPDGTARKLLDVSRMSALGWQAKTPLDQGIALAYEAFLAGRVRRL